MAPACNVEGFGAAALEILKSDVVRNQARAALEDARDALFHGAPVTVGLERQIHNAIAALSRASA